MLKSAESVKTVEHQAAEALGRLLQEVPAIRLLSVEHVPERKDEGIDLAANVEASGRRFQVVCQVKAAAQPRQVRMSLLQLRSYVEHHAPNAVPLLIAPYLSPKARTQCLEEAVGFLDLEGNARLVFDGIFIERQVASRPVAERRELRSMFKPKAALVLRALLRNPDRAWRVAELAQTAGVSLGHVSNVRSALLDREWAQVSEQGLFLLEPDALLNEWRAVYEPPAGRQMSFYTTLHGVAFENAVRQALSSAGSEGLAAWASFSAAHWLAPYGRTGMQYFYSDEEGLEKLRLALRLSPISKGENVSMTVLDDSGLFRDTVEPAPGAICTSPVQTYLDLFHAGERGREAAAHLRQEKLAWPK